MDELESQIARIGRLEPSAALDARIESLLNRKPSRVARHLRIASILATAACAGAIGFLLGRQSAPNSAQATAQASLPALGDVSPPPSLQIVASEDQLADFFIRRSGCENILGGSPHIEMSSSPN